MMNFLRSIVLLLALVKRGQSASLATPFDGKPDNEDASDGDKFSITTKDSAIVLESFDIHMMNTSATIQIWTRTGCRNVTDTWSLTTPKTVYFACGYPGSGATNTWDWTQRYSGTLTGLGQNVSTPMPVINLFVPSNTTLGVYITSTTYDGNHIYHTLAPKYFSGPWKSPGSPTPSFVADDYISIHEGISEKFDQCNYIYPTRWNGKWRGSGHHSMTSDELD